MITKIETIREVLMSMKKVLSVLTIGIMLASNIISVNATSYTVQPGDTLSEISAENNISVKEIMDINDITDANRIYAGQSLTLANATNSSSNMHFKSLYELFDAEYYAKQYPDIVSVYGTSKDALYKHFLSYGVKENRSISADFDVNSYKSAYPDLVTAFGTDILKYYEHYIMWGQKENRTLVTANACISEGIIVSDFNGNVLHAPIMNQNSNNTFDNNDNDSEHPQPPTNNTYDLGDGVDRLYGVLYVNTCGKNLTNEDSCSPSLGAFPYPLQTLIDNGDNTYTVYEVWNHGGWLDQQWVDFDTSGNDNVILPSGYISEMVGGSSWHSCVGGYDEGCIHKQLVRECEHPNWVSSKDDGYGNTWCYCTSCAFTTYKHIDEDNNGSCDHCGNPVDVS